MHMSTVRKLKGHPTMLKEKSNTDCLKTTIFQYITCIAPTTVLRYTLPFHGPGSVTLKEFDRHQFYIPLFKKIATP